MDQLTEPIGMSTPIRVRTFMLWGLGALVLVVAFGAVVQSTGSSSSGPPEPTAAMLDEMRMVDDYAADGDCHAIAGHRADVLADLGAPGTEQHLQAATLARYAESAQRRVGCVIVDDDPVTIGPKAGSSRSAAH